MIKRDETRSTHLTTSARITSLRTTVKALHRSAFSSASHERQRSKPDTLERFVMRSTTCHAPQARAPKPSAPVVAG